MSGLEDVDEATAQWRSLIGQNRVTATEIGQQLVARHASVLDAWGDRPVTERLSKSNLWSKNPHNRHSAPGLYATGSMLSISAQQYSPNSQSTMGTLSFDPDFMPEEITWETPGKTKKELGAATATRRRRTQSRTAMFRVGMNLKGVCKACGDMVGDCEACHAKKKKVFIKQPSGEDAPAWSIQNKLNKLNERFKPVYNKRLNELDIHEMRNKMYDMSTENKFQKGKHALQKQKQEATAAALCATRHAMKDLQVAMGMMDVAMATAKWR
jgi:hypothetical protein